MGDRSSMASVGYDQILSSLRFMGIREGDVLLVHSALTSIGYVEGGADGRGARDGAVGGSTPW